MYAQANMAHPSREEGIVLRSNLGAADVAASRFDTKTNPQPRPWFIRQLGVATSAYCLYPCHA